MLFGKTVGYIASLSYDRDYNSYRNGFTGRYTLTENEETAVSLNGNLELEDAKSTESVLWGAMLMGAMKLNDLNKMSLTLLYNQKWRI